MVQKKFFTEVVLLTKSYNLQDFKDWLHWHLNIIGFQHAHIFDNESSVDIKSVCESYGGRVSYELVTGWPNQYALYNRYINNESPAWWVLPIDDDEFVWISDKYRNNINKILITLQQRLPNMCKLSIGWRNMWPKEYKETRSESLIDNATAWSNEVSEAIYPLWRQDNRWIKTIALTTSIWYWGLPYNGGHNPTSGGTAIASNLIDNRTTMSDFILPPCNTNDFFIAHYQYKSNSEWVMKCTRRKSAANKSFNKNKPSVYKEIYKHINKFNLFTDMSMLWHNSNNARSICNTDQ